MEGNTSDVTFVLADGARLACHTTIVADASTKLGRLVQSTPGTPGKPVEVKLDGIDSGTMAAVLQYLYSSQLTLSPDAVIPILDAAIKLEIQQVQTVCNHYLEQALSIDSLGVMLVQAIKLGQEEVADKLIQWAGPRLAEISASPAFKSCDESVIKRLLLAHKGNEAAVRAAVTWLEADQAGRSHLAQGLLSPLGAQLVHQPKPTSSYSQGHGGAGPSHMSPQILSAAAQQQQEQQQPQLVQLPGALPDNSHLVFHPALGHLQMANNLMFANASALQAMQVQQQLASLHQQQQHLQLLQHQLIVQAAGQSLPVGLQPGLPLPGHGGLVLPFVPTAGLMPQVLPGGLMLGALMPQAAALAVGASQLPLLAQHLQQQVIALGGQPADPAAKLLGLQGRPSDLSAQAQGGRDAVPRSPGQVRRGGTGSRAPSSSRYTSQTATEAYPQTSGQEAGRRPHTTSSAGMPSPSARGSQGRQGSGVSRGREMEMDPLSSLAAAAALASSREASRAERASLPPSLSPTPLAAVAVRRKRLREGSAGEGQGAGLSLPPVSTTPHTPQLASAEATPRSEPCPQASIAPNQAAPKPESVPSPAGKAPPEPHASPPDTAALASAQDSHASLPAAVTALTSMASVVVDVYFKEEEEEAAAGQGVADEKRSSTSEGCAIAVVPAAQAKSSTADPGPGAGVGDGSGSEPAQPDASAQSQVRGLVPEAPSPSPAPVWPVGPRAVVLAQDTTCPSRPHVNGTRVVDARAPSLKQIAAVLGPEWRAGSVGVLVVDGVLTDKGSTAKAKPVVLPQPPKLKGVCHVDSCMADLSHLRDYHVRFRVCDFHLKASSVMRHNQPQRFCQQCGRFHGVGDFDGAKRSCRSRLQRHNARRRKKGEEGGAGGGEADEEEEGEVEEGAERRPAAGAGVVNGKHANTHAWTSCGTYTSTMATYASPLFGPTSSGDQPLMPPGTQFVIAGRGGYTGQTAVVRRWRPLGALPAHRLLPCSPAELPLPSAGTSFWCPPPAAGCAAPPALPEALARVGSIQGIIAADW